MKAREVHKRTVESNELNEYNVNSPKAVPKEVRDIYPNQLGRLDLNSISHGPNTALSFMLCPTAYVDKQGFFSKDARDPDVFNDKLKQLKKQLQDADILSRKQEIESIKVQSIITAEQRRYMKKLMDDEGRFDIGKRINIIKDENTGRVVIADRRTGNRTYMNENGMLLTDDNRFIVSRYFTPEYEEDGRLTIGKHKSKLRNEDGRIVIKPRKGFNKTSAMLLQHAHLSSNEIDK